MYEKEALEDLFLSRIYLASTKRTSNMTKIKLTYFFFVRNRCRSQQGHNKFFKKKFWDTNPFYSLDTHNVIFDL